MIKTEYSLKSMATGSRSKEESSKIILNASRNVPVDEVIVYL